MSRARDVADGALGTIAGTNGQVLTSDGNNWSSQAVPTELPAHGTSGNLLTSNGSAWASEANPLPAHGTSGNVLTSTGSAWASQAAAGGGAWTFLSEVVSTSSTTIDFSNAFNSTYDNYRITANNVGSNTTNVNYSASIELSNNIGSYYAYQYFIRLQPSSTSTWTYGGGGEFANNQNNTGSAAQRSNFVADIFNPRSSNSKGVNFYGNALCGFGTISFQYILSALQFNSPTTEQTGIRFQASSGTMTGTFRLYGFAKS